jgi:NADPH:quinone reductase-like Zn-dependent oxidoreductase
MTPTTMRAVVLRAPGGSEQLVCDHVATPEPDAGQALVRVHAAALTRDELEWPVDRLPAIPSYELSGVVVALGPGVESLAVGDEVFGLTAFDRDGVAADYAAIPTELLAPKPHSLSHVEAAAGPLAALSAWQGLLEHGRLAAGERVLIHGATGGVGQFATLLASRHGAHVIATTSAPASSVHTRSALTSSSTTPPSNGTRASNPSTSSSTPPGASDCAAPPASCERVVGWSR